MDNADKAQDLIEMRTNHAIQANRAKFSGADIGEPYCLSCGIEIPLARRQAVHNCEYCIDCQQAIELRRKQLMGK